MSRSDDTFTYSDLLACLQVLRGRATGRPLAYVVALVGGFIMEGDLRRMLRYFVRKGTVEQRDEANGRVYLLSGPSRASGIVHLKVEKSQAPWNGKWNVFTYDIPEHSNTARRRLARLLHRMGFGMLSASSWVSPYDWRDTLSQALREWACAGAFSYVGPAAVTTLGKASESYPMECWELRGLRTTYNRIAQRCANAPRSAGAWERKARARIAFAATKELASIGELDPMLPAELLPDDWPRARALRCLERLRSAVQADAQHAARSLG